MVNDFKVKEDKIQVIYNAIDNAENYLETTTKEELFIYFSVVREYRLNLEIARLKELMKKEVDPIEMAKIGERIRKLRMGE